MLSFTKWFPIALALLGLQSVHAKKPNIIFLLADDQSTYSVGCYGNEDVKTPQMDKLGAEGMVFDRHYVTSPICMSSRANIFTGMYEYKTGTNFGHGDMKPEVWQDSYPVHLRQAGYLTAFAGKFGIVVDGKGICEEEFDIWAGAKGQSSFRTDKNPALAKYAKEFPHSTLAYGAWGQDVIRTAVEQGKPFCMSISFKAPHKPATPDPRFDAVYAGKTFKKPENFGRAFADHLAPQSKKGRQWARFTEWKYDTDYDAQMRLYYQQIYGIDVALSMLREELEKQGAADNTVIIYTSDNGYLCGSHGYGSKEIFLEESSRVPLIVHDPRLPESARGKRSRELTCNIDFAPTILNLAELPIPAKMDGHSILPILTDPNTGGHAAITLFNGFIGNCMSVVTQNKKYTYWAASKGLPAFEEMFDLKKDPYEKVNLALNPESAPLLEKMRESYRERLAMLQKEAVSYNGYAKYAITLDPDATPAAKQEAIRAATKAKKKTK
ncbi:sulfatase [Rubritalea spongiae]|uniref:Sulfatase n=1 Tax=Rubritalea spongiae TaxID=430797 RepID=A0ABW5E3H4_9BACT